MKKSTFGVIWLTGLLNVTCAACSDGELRLQGGMSQFQGRVEICMDAVWGSVCFNLWDNDDAAVVCRQLGFSYQGIVMIECWGSVVMIDAVV